MAINIAVTWACARWSNHSPDSSFRSAPFTGTLPPEAAEYLNDPTYLELFGSNRPTGLTHSTTSSWTSTRREFSRWHDIEAIGYSRSHACIQFGWPFRSFEYAEHSWFNIATSPEFASWRIEGWRGGWPLALDAHAEADSFSSYLRPDHIYPLTPIPLGLLANTAFYTLLTLGLVRSLGLIRRTNRHRKALCPHCAYPIGTSPACTECGKPIPLATSAT